MGEDDNEPLVPDTDFYPEPDMFQVWVSEKKRKGSKDGQPVIITYWEGCWDVPLQARAADDTRKRPQITASSPNSPQEAEDKCRAKVLDFWLERSAGIRQETYQQTPARLSKEQRAAGYTVKSFLEEYAASKSNPNTMQANRWMANTERNNRTILTKWIYPYLGDIPLNQITHQMVRLHFTETLPNVLDRNDERRLNDARIRGIYSTFRAGLNRAGAKGLVETGEFLDVGIQMSFDAAGVPEDIDNLMWEMNALLQRADVIADPDALRWALAYGQGLRRGERCGLKWSDINMLTRKMTVRRQLSYVVGQPEFLDERLKAGDTRTIPITALTYPFLVEARKRRDELEASGWKAKDGFEDVVLLRSSDGSPENLNHDSTLFHDFMKKYQVLYRKLSPGSLRHACATFHANYGGPDGRGVQREKLREFMGHTPRSDLDAYYARSSQIAMDREFGGPVLKPYETSGEAIQNVKVNAPEEVG